MPLTIRTFNTIMSQLQTTLANNTPKITNLKSGSVALALLQTLAGNTLAIQQLISHVYNTCRLSTSTGSDVDSYVADFGLSRLPAVASSGTETLSRTASGTILYVAVGGVVQSLSGVQWTIIADTTQPSWNPTQNAYEFQTTELSIPVTVQATTTGSATNAAPNTITQIVSGLTGVGSVSNAVGFYNGADAETDGALRLRFQKYISSLARATVPAVAAAILGVQTNIRYNIIEYLHFNGEEFDGGFTAVIADTSGNANSTLITNTTTAINAVRAAGISFEVDAPTKEVINSQMHITVPTGGNLSAAQIAAATAVTAYINSLQIGQNVSLADLAHAAETATGVFSVTILTINGVSADFTIQQTQLAVPGSVIFI